MWPNLKAAVAKLLRIVGLIFALYLLLWPWLKGKMSNSDMKSVPITTGSHSLYVICWKMIWLTQVKEKYKPTCISAIRILLASW